VALQSGLAVAGHAARHAPERSSAPHDPQDSGGSEGSHPKPAAHPLEARSVAGGLLGFRAGAQVAARALRGG